MRHRKAGIKLSRTPSHRNAMFRNMVTSLLKYDRIQTTGAKAKELRRWADHLITLAKKGDLHARRQALAIVTEKDVVHKLFENAAERFGAISGGYTRIVKLGRRPGDAAPVSLIELVVTQETKKKKTKKKGAKAKAAPQKKADDSKSAAAEKTEEGKDKKAKKTAKPKSAAAGKADKSKAKTKESADVVEDAKGAAEAAPEKSEAVQAKQADDDKKAPAGKKGTAAAKKGDSPDSAEKEDKE